jgi:hypothetical protein
VVITLVLVRGGGEGPEDTAEAFIQAAQDRDCDKALSLISEDLKKQEDANCEEDSDLLPPKDTKIEFGDVKISNETDDSATATVDATIGGQTLPLKIKLVKEDGDWKVDQLGG